MLRSNRVQNEFVEVVFALGGVVELLGIDFEESFSEESHVGHDHLVGVRGLLLA